MVAKLFGRYPFDFCSWVLFSFGIVLCQLKKFQSFCELCLDNAFLLLEIMN